MMSHESSTPDWLHVIGFFRSLVSCKQIDQVINDASVTRDHIMSLDSPESKVNIHLLIAISVVSSKL